MKTLKDIKKEVDLLTDGLNKPVDKGIKPIVIALRYLGFNTTGSCEGHMNWGYPYPWVDIDSGDKRLNKKEKRRLSELLRQFYKHHESAHSLLLQDFAAFRLQNVRWPRTRKKRARHQDIPDAKLLKQYQNEMNSFADYLVSLGP